MKEEEIAQLLKKYRAGTCTEQEKAFLDSWYIQYEAAEPNELSFADREEDLNEVWYALDASYRKTHRLTLWRQVAAVAAMLILVLGGIWFFLGDKIVNPPSRIVTVADIPPGGNRATLSFADGRSIQLSEAQGGIIVDEGITYADGTAVLNDSLQIKNRKSSIVNLMSISTPRGGQYQIQLPDGTKVWLNAASSLNYPASFAGLAERRVELIGEAYFEVAKNKDKPFLVLSSGQSVEVLGTHFNVRAYADEPTIQTTLLEGSVLVQSKVPSKTASVQLVPGEAAILQSGQLEKQPVNTEIAIAWKNEKFMFDNEDIASIMRMVERWYDVEVIYEGEKPTDKFGGSVSRFDKISKVLSILELTGKVHFRVEGKKIYVSK